MKKMTVCLVSPFSPPIGGMAVQAEKLCYILKTAGFEVVPVRTNSCFPDSFKWAVNLPFLRTVFNMAFFLINLNNALKKCDVVYFLTGFFNFFFWITLPAILLIKLSGNKIVLNARGGGAEAFFIRWKYLVRPFVKMSDIIVTPSGFLKAVFEKYLDVNPVIVPNIADFEQFNFIERRVFKPHLIVSRGLEEIYNVACVINAFKLVHDVFSDSRLIIAGDGSQRLMLEDLVNSLNLKEAVYFKGFVAHHNIQKLYDESDIFVNASNVDNFPGSLLEAFASGLPVVSTNAGGIPFMVEHEKTGLLVKKGDYQDLAKQVLRLLDDQALAYEIAQNAGKECLKYSSDSVKKRLVLILKQL